MLKWLITSLLMKRINNIVLEVSSEIGWITILAVFISGIHNDTINILAFPDKDY